jgi:hypothetical protein
MKKYCAYVDCTTEIQPDQAFCVPCRIDKCVIGVSDQNTAAKKMGYKNWIGWTLVNRGLNIRPNWEESQGSLPAAVSKGRWYAKCPDDTCRNNIPLNELTPKAFCVDCLNIKNDFKAYTVEWDKRKSIKHIMAARIDMRRRNYLPHAGETIQSLTEENERYGWSLDGI